MMEDITTLDDIKRRGETLRDTPKAIGTHLDRQQRQYTLLFDTVMAIAFDDEADPRALAAACLIAWST